MKNLSLLFSGRGSNVNSILSHIIKKRLNFDFNNFSIYYNPEWGFHGRFPCWSIL